jgi:hypothetical protein
VLATKALGCFKWYQMRHWCGLCVAVAGVSHCSEAKKARLWCCGLLEDWGSASKVPLPVGLSAAGRTYDVPDLQHAGTRRRSFSYFDTIEILKMDLMVDLMMDLYACVASHIPKRAVSTIAVL